VCGKPITVEVDGYYISGGYFAGEYETPEGIVEEWLCNECIFINDYENT